MTLQEVFEKVVIHLLTQNKQSKDDSGFCLYRNHDDLSCAVGCLINDDLYDPAIEGYGVACTAIENLLKESGVDCIALAKDMLFDLQHIHDSLTYYQNNHTFARRINKVATDNKVEITDNIKVQFHS